MNESLNISKSVEARSVKHLSPGVRPIMACVGSFGDFDFTERAFLHENYDEELDGVTNVKWGAPYSYLKVRKFLNAGDQAYVISPLDSSKKFSSYFINCTGLIVSGKRKKTGEYISFFSHQRPQEIIFDNKDEFVEDLTLRLNEVLVECEPGTIDAVIVGGNYISADHFTEKYKDDKNATPELLAKKAKDSQVSYLRSVEIISDRVKEVLGFEPTVINGPKLSTGFDDIYYDNDERKVYLLRGEVNARTGDFTHSEIEKRKKGWDSGNPPESVV